MIYAAKVAWIEVLQPGAEKLKNRLNVLDEVEIAIIGVCFMVVGISGFLVSSFKINLLRFLFLVSKQLCF